jgi:hypothetical protein
VDRFCGLHRGYSVAAAIADTSASFMRSAVIVLAPDGMGVSVLEAKGYSIRSFTRMLCRPF